MKSTTKQTKTNANNANSTDAIAIGAVREQTVEVLYQKMGNRWFAFSVQGDDVFVGSISQEEIDELHASSLSTEERASANPVLPIVGNS